MAVKIPWPTLSNPANKTEVEEDIDALKTKFDGEIENDDISDDANIATSKLATLYQTQYMIVTLKASVMNAYVPAFDLSGGLDAGAASLSAVTADDIVAMSGVPGVNGDASWTVEDVSWYCTDTGDGATTFDVKWAYANAAGTLVVDTTAVSEEIITNASGGAGTPNGEAGTVDSATLAYSTNSPHYLLLTKGAAAGVGTVSNEADHLIVTVTLSRSGSIN